MELTIRSIFTCLLLTSAFALPVNQANATPIKHGDEHYQGSGSDFKKDKDFDREFEFVGKWGGFAQKKLKPKEVLHELQGRSGGSGYGYGYGYGDGYGDGHGYGHGYGDGGGKCEHKKCDHDDDDDGHSVPEPNPLALLGLGLVVIGLVRRFVPARHS
jgi:hypothetical protein